MARGMGRASLRSVGPSGMEKFRMIGLERRDARLGISALLASHDKAWIMVLGFWRVKERSSVEPEWHECMKSKNQLG